MRVLSDVAFVSAPVRGWFLEQWLARAGLPYADNDNGRTARATQVLFNTPESAEMLTFAQDLVEDELAVYVGEDPRGLDGLLRIADPRPRFRVGRRVALGPTPRARLQEVGCVGEVVVDGQPVDPGALGYLAYGSVGWPPRAV